MNIPIPRLAAAFALSLAAHAFILALVSRPATAHNDAASVLYSQLFADQGGYYAHVN